MAQRMRRLPAEVDAYETMDGVLNMIEWFQVEADRNTARQEAT